MAPQRIIFEGRDLEKMLHLFVELVPSLTAYRMVTHPLRVMANSSKLAMGSEINKLRRGPMLLRRLGSRYQHSYVPAFERFYTGPAYSRPTLLRYLPPSGPLCLATLSTRHRGYGVLHTVNRLE